MNYFFIIKIILSAVIIAVVTEIAKRNPTLGGLIAAMPITTLLAIFWIYYEQKSIPIITDFLISVIYGVFISLIFFVVAIFLFKKGVSFYITIFISLTCLAISAYIYNKFIL